jgi:hypothetical protein
LFLGKEFPFNFLVLCEQWKNRVFNNNTNHLKEVTYRQVDVGRFKWKSENIAGTFLRPRHSKDATLRDHENESSHIS